VQVSRYIHLNPVAANLAEHPEHWPWSSAAAYLEHSCGPQWLHTTTILAMFGGPNQRAEYRAFLRAGIDTATARFYAGLE
jgi:hypothetical protein